MHVHHTRGLLGEETLFNAASFHASSADQCLVQGDEWSHVSTLQRHSLVVDSPRPTLLGEVAMVAMNSHAQDVVREQLMGGSRKAALGGILRALGIKMAAFDSGHAATHDEGQRFARHVKAAASHARHDSAGGGGEVVAALCQRAGCFYSEVAGSYEDALEMHMVALGARLRAVGPDHVDVAETRMSLAQLHQAQGELEQALEHLEQSQQILAKACGPEHPSVISAWNRIADVYDAQGLHEKAGLTRRVPPS